MKKQGVHRGKGPRRKLCVCVCMLDAHEKVCTSNRTGSVDRYVCVFLGNQGHSMSSLTES